MLLRSQPPEHACVLRKAHFSTTIAVPACLLSTAHMEAHLDAAEVHGIIAAPQRAVIAARQALKFVPMSPQRRLHSF